MTQVRVLAETPVADVIANRSDVKGYWGRDVAAQVYGYYTNPELRVSCPIP